MGDRVRTIVRQAVPPGADPADARRAARDILARPEYAEPEPSIVERAGEWVLDRIGSFFGTLTGGGPGTVIGWVVVVLLVLGATWLVARALRVPGVPDHHPGPALRYGTETRRDPAEWAAEAARLAAAGDLRGALRCRYQAVVATAVAERLVDDVPGRTSGEYRRLLTERLPAQADDVAVVTELFDQAWYGGAAVDAGAYERFRAHCEAIERAALHRAAAV